MENNSLKRSRSRSTSKKESLENKKVIEKEKKAQEDLDKAKDALLLDMNMKDHFEEIMGLVNTETKDQTAAAPDNPHYEVIEEEK